MGNPSKPSRVLIGVVVSCHGLKGELVVEPQTDSLDRFDDFEAVFVAQEPEPREVLSWRPHKGRVLLTLAGIQDRNQAEALRSARLEIPFEERAELPEGRYYHDDLVGLRVVDSSGEAIGQVLGFDDRTSNGLVQVRTEAGRRFEVPFAEAWIPEVDLEAGKLVLSDGWRGLLNPVDA